MIREHMNTSDMMHDHSVEKIQGSQDSSMFVIDLSAHSFDQLVRISNRKESLFRDVHC